MPIYCQKCGSKLNGYDCSVCGTRYQVKKASHSPPPYGLMPNKKPNSVISTLKMYEIINSIVWFLIGVLQIFLFQFSFLIGIANIIHSILGLIYLKNIRPYNYDVYVKYEKDLPNIVIMIIINLILGAGIGVIGAVYEIYIRSYVLKNRFAFNNI